MTTKLLTILLSPLGTALLLGVLTLLLALLARWRFFRRAGYFCGLFAVVWLWVWSTPLASDILRGWIEDQAGPRLVEQVPQTEVMVVLGGGISGPRPPQRPYPDLGAAADRLWHAARLFHAGKAERILLSGGAVRTGNGSEAEAMQRLLLDLGVPATALLLEPGSGDTTGNARLTANLLAEEEISEVLLVTSALHMPRARRLFERAGLTVIPAPTDFEVIPMPFDLLRVMPDARALDGSGRAMKELVGWVVAGRSA